MSSRPRSTGGRHAFKGVDRLRLPPLGALPYFEAAGRHGSFKKAAEELCRTPTAVSGRIRALEDSLGFPLFDRLPSGVNLSRRGQDFLADVHRILAEIEDLTERHRSGGRSKRLRVVSAEFLAEKWLIPKLARFTRRHPEIDLTLVTDHGVVDAGRRQFDVWIRFASEVKGDFHVETLFEGVLVPVCSPAFLAERGRPRTPADLRSFPLLYDLAWEECWALWFAAHGVPAPDLSQASGFRLYSTVIQAALSGIGVALGYSRLIAPELDQGALVMCLDLSIAAPARYWLVTQPGRETHDDTQAFRSWILEEAGRLSSREISAALACPAG